jgi:hypothetical protein
VLLVGYVSRFLRNLKQALIVRDDLHARGAALLFCDERILSSEEDRWDEFVREAHEAESYSRKLARRVREGLAAKRRRLGEPGGRPPFGFRRSGRPPVLEPDDGQLGQMQRAFQLAASGATDRQVSLDLGLPLHTVRSVLTNPIYIGVLRDGQPARVGPVIDRETWERAQAHRNSHARRHPGHSTTRSYVLAKLLYCAACGRRLTGHVGRYRHVEPCAEFVRAKPHVRRRYSNRLDRRVKGQSYTTETYEALIPPILAHVSLGALTLTQVIEGLGELPVDTMTGVRLERERRYAAERFARDRDLVRFQATLARLDAEEAQVPEVEPVTAQQAVAWLRDLPELWADAPESHRQLAVALFERWDVLGTRSVAIVPTQHAIAHGFDAAFGVRLVGMVGARGLRVPVSLHRTPVRLREAS